MKFWAKAFEFLNTRDLAKRKEKADRKISIASINASKELKLAAMRNATSPVPNQATDSASTPSMTKSILSGSGGIISGGIAIAIGIVVIMFMRFAKAS